MAAAGYERHRVRLVWLRLDNRWYRRVQFPSDLVELRPCAYGDALGVDCGVDYYSKYDWVVPQPSAAVAAREDCADDVVLFLTDVHRYTARLRPPAGLRVDGEYAYGTSAPHRYFNDWGPDLSAARYQLHYVPQPCVSVMLPAGAQLTADRPVGVRYQQPAEDRGGQTGAGFWGRDGVYPTLAELTALRPRHAFAPGLDGTYERWCLLPALAQREQDGRGHRGGQTADAATSTGTSSSTGSAAATRAEPVEVGSGGSSEGGGSRGAAGARKVPRRSGQARGGRAAGLGPGRGASGSVGGAGSTSPQGPAAGPAPALGAAPSPTAATPPGGRGAAHLLSAPGGPGAGTAGGAPVASGAPPVAAGGSTSAASSSAVRSSAASSSTSGTRKRVRSRAKNVPREATAGRAAATYAPGRRAEACLHATVAAGAARPEPPPGAPRAPGRPLGSTRGTSAGTSTSASSGGGETTDGSSEETVEESQRSSRAAPAPRPARKTRARGGGGGRPPPRPVAATARRSRYCEVHPAATVRAANGCCPTGAFFGCPLHTLPLQPQLSEQGYTVLELDDPAVARPAPDVHDALAWALGRVKPTAFRTSTKVTTPHALLRIPRHRLRQFLFEWHMEELVEVWRVGNAEYRRVAAGLTDGRTQAYAGLPVTSVPAHWAGHGTGATGGGGSAAGAASGSASADAAEEIENPPSVAPDGEFSHRLYWSIARAAATAGLRISPGHSFACEGYPLGSLTELEADLQPSHLDVDAGSVDIQPRSGSIAFVNICRDHHFRICIWPRSHLAADPSEDPPDGVPGTLVAVPPGHMVLMDYRLRHCGLARPPWVDHGPKRVFRPWIQLLLTTHQPAAQGQRLGEYHREAVRQKVPMANTSESRKVLGPANPLAPMMVAVAGLAETAGHAATGSQAAAPAGSASGVALAATEAQAMGAEAGGGASSAPSAAASGEETAPEVTPAGSSSAAAATAAAGLATEATTTAAAASTGVAGPAPAATGGGGA